MRERGGGLGGKSLGKEVARLAAATGADAVAVAVHDYQTGAHEGIDADRWFHAASTIKVAVLLGVFGAIDEGRFELRSRVHVRNRFLSAVDGQPYRIEASRDANSAVHAAIGKTMRVSELAHHMIVTSSNLATNLLIDVVGLESIQRTLGELELDGIDLCRGVEDDVAWQRGLNNRLTASGLCRALRLIEERRAISKEASEAMLEMLLAQQFRSGIPKGVPESARVAHKTGETSTTAHDAGIVYLEDRKPYVVVILTEWPPDGTGRQALIANLSKAVCEHVTD